MAKQAAWPGTAVLGLKSVGPARPDQHTRLCRAGPWAAPSAQARPTSSRAVPCQLEGTSVPSCLFKNKSIFPPSSLGCDIYIAKISLVSLPPIWANIYIAEISLFYFPILWTVAYNISIFTPYSLCRAWPAGPSCRASSVVPVGGGGQARPSGRDRPARA